MDWEKQCMRLCTTVLTCAVALRLAAGGVFAPVGQFLTGQEAISFFLYLQTGRSVRINPEEPALPIFHLSPTEPPEEPDRPSFSESDLSLVEMHYGCRYRPELEPLMTRPIRWDLTGDKPTVLILHTHGTECYTKSEGESYEPSGDYRTLDEDYNMLCLGALVAKRLEEAGIRCIHDRQLHDYPDYSGSYQNAAASTEALLQQYPDIRLVLDLHRDASDTAYGQLVTECSIGSRRAAQLMMVVGTDAGGLHHPQWEENLSLALKLQVLLERENPGICRPMKLTYNRYNQHLGERALLIEIGAAGNTLEEAALAAEALARSIVRLAGGTE